MNKLHISLSLSLLLSVTAPLMSSENQMNCDDLAKYIEQKVERNYPRAAMGQDGKLHRIHRYKVDCNLSLERNLKIGKECFRQDIQSCDCEYWDSNQALSYHVPFDHSDSLLTKYQNALTHCFQSSSTSSPLATQLIDTIQKQKALNAPCRAEGIAVLNRLKERETVPAKIEARKKKFDEYINKS